MSIVDKLKSNKMVCKCYSLACRVALPIFDGLSITKQRKMLKNYRSCDGGTIKVAFLVQFFSAWNKFEALYREILSDDRFDAQIICVPDGLKDISVNGKKNDAYESFIEHGYEAVNALNSDGSWYDLRSRGFDCVFYDRPYNVKLPRVYQSKTVSGYARICNIMYAMMLAEEIYDISMKRDFFKDAYLFFAETETSAERFKQRFPYTVKKGLKHVCYLGMPGSEQILNDRDLKTDIWDFAGNRFKVMWTPRWTTNPQLGGSNFFVYYKEILKFAKANPDIAVLIRPHPLTFENFIKTGELTLEEQNEFRKEIAETDNVILDETSEYDATMWNSDVMISDFSAIMAEYFITGKPLIFCSSNMYLTPDPSFKRMLEGCYDAPDKETAFDKILSLKNGNDEKKELRRRLANDLFKLNEPCLSKRMVDYLYDCIIHENDAEKSN